ncbi:MAG TPA: ribose-5-phosphate isomerase RpiA [Methanomicrobia archaeon]|nr:ribose-5-phosphate isomerase RpiA [Methanomicrobia archaeon]
MSDAIKRQEKDRAAVSAAALVKDGMIIGLGTGSTAERVIRLLGDRVKAEGLAIRGVPTSLRTELLAIECGIPLTSLTAHPLLDLGIDGADQVDARLNLLKGGWGSQTREKVVSYAAQKLIICVESVKVVEHLYRPVPIEVLPYAVTVVSQQVNALGGKPGLRLDGSRGGYFITEQGNLIIDADFGVIRDPNELSVALSAIVGAVEHGIFTNAAEVHVGTAQGVTILKKASVTKRKGEA